LNFEKYEFAILGYFRVRIVQMIEKMRAKAATKEGIFREQQLLKVIDLYNGIRINVSVSLLMKILSFLPYSDTSINLLENFVI
jgi:hypothetical protein